MEYEPFTQEEEAAAMDAIIAERDALRTEVGALRDELAAVGFAAHMPDGYKYGLPSWINQHLYAAYIDASFSEIVLEKIRQGRLTFPESPSYRLIMDMTDERDALRDEVERLRDELNNLRARNERPPGGGPPPEIYLQWYGDDDGYYLIDDAALVADVTWCDTRVWPRDVRYVRADDTAAAPDEEE